MRAWREALHPRDRRGRWSDRFRIRTQAPHPTDWHHDFTRRIAARFPGVKGELSRHKKEPNSLYLERIVVPKNERGKGTGRAIMAALLADADAHGTTLWLSPEWDDSPDGINPGRLENWYASMGFQRVVTRRAERIGYPSMRREPRPVRPARPARARRTPPPRR